MGRGTHSAWQLALLHRQIDELLGRLLRAPEREPALWTPAFDILDHGDRLVVRVDLPGIDRRAIDVHLAEGVLIISGARKPPRDAEPRRYLRMERSFGSFFLELPLPVPCDESRARATQRAGVLQIVLPCPTGQKRGSWKVVVEEGES